MMNMKIYPKFLTLFAVALLCACAPRPAPMGGPDSPFGYNAPQGTLPQAQQVPVNTNRNGGAQTLGQAGQQDPVIDPFSNTQAEPVQATKTKIGLLLPLTGQHAKIGNALLQSAQLALFDMGASHVQLLPKDTGATAQGAASAAQALAAQDVDLIIGPLFAQSVSGAKPVAQRNNISLIAFSTDRTVAGRGAYLMGVLPEEQAERMADYAARRGLTRVGIVAGADNYGHITSGAFRQRAAALGIQIVGTAQYGTSEFASLLASSPQAIFLPVGGAQASTIAQKIKTDSPGTLLLGTGLWDSADIATKTGMEGAIYAAPSPALRRNFEAKYNSLYGEAAPRIASIAYDATALAVVISQPNKNVQQTGMQQAGLTQFKTIYSQEIAKRSGFSGIDGIFRFRPDGTAQRGLAVLTIRGGRPSVIEAAPSSFGNNY